MNFKIKNFGKIAEADIKLDGITVICGNNNTGKSTVGKALFAFYNSLVNYKNKIAVQKSNAISSFVFQNLMHVIKDPKVFFEHNDSFEFVSSHKGDYSVEEIKQYIEDRFSAKISSDKAKSLVASLNVSEYDVLNEYIFRYFNSTMNAQIKKVDSGKGKCYVIAEFKDGKNVLNFTAKKCEVVQECPILHSAYYINNPFALDFLNENGSYRSTTSFMDRKVINAIINAQAAINEDSMTNILDSVINKKDLDEVRIVIKKAYSGNTKYSNGKYFYCEDGIDFDFRNISTGLKAFALIERLLECGVLKKKDVLILDEPEIHLHSEWQIIYAELIVILQQKFDLTILLVTHSFQFLESLDFFMRKYESSDKGNYYIPELTDKGFVMKSCGNNPNELKQNLMKGSVKIADMEFEYDMEQDHDDT